MVRRKIEIKYIENNAKRHVTFTKRRDGLFRKAMSYCTKSNSIAAVIAITQAGNVYSTAHPHINTVLSQYYAHSSSKGKDVVDKEKECSSCRLTEETQKIVSEAMKRGRVESALKNVGFEELGELEMVCKSMLGDTVLRRRQAELNVKD